MTTRTPETHNESQKPRSFLNKAALAVTIAAGSMRAHVADCLAGPPRKQSSAVQRIVDRIMPVAPAWKKNDTLDAGLAGELRLPKNAVVADHAAGHGLIVVGLTMGNIVVYDEQSGALLQSFHGNNQAITAMAMHPERLEVAVLAGGTLKIVDIVTGEVIDQLALRDAATDIEIDPTGRFAAVAMATKAVHIYDMATGSFTARRVTGQTDDLDIDPLTDTIAIESGKNVKIYEEARNKIIRELKGLTGVVRCVDWDPTGRYVVAGDAMGETAMWNVANGRLVYRERLETALPEGGVRSIEFSNDGQTVVAVKEGGSGVILDVATMRSDPFEAVRSSFGVWTNARLSSSPYKKRMYVTSNLPGMPSSLRAINLEDAVVKDTPAPVPAPQPQPAPTPVVPAPAPQPVVPAPAPVPAPEPTPPAPVIEPQPEPVVTPMIPIPEPPLVIPEPTPIPPVEPNPEPVPGQTSSPDNTASAEAFAAAMKTAATEKMSDLEMSMRVDASQLPLLLRTRDELNREYVPVTQAIAAQQIVVQAAVKEFDNAVATLAALPGRIQQALNQGKRTLAAQLERDTRAISQGVDTAADRLNAANADMATLVAREEDIRRRREANDRMIDAIYDRLGQQSASLSMLGGMTGMTAESTQQRTTEIITQGVREGEETMPHVRADVGILDMDVGNGPASIRLLDKLVTEILPHTYATGLTKVKAIGRIHNAGNRDGMVTVTIGGASDTYNGLLNPQTISVYLRAGEMRDFVAIIDIPRGSDNKVGTVKIAATSPDEDAILQEFKQRTPRSMDDDSYVQGEGAVKHNSGVIMATEGTGTSHDRLVKYLLANPVEAASIARKIATEEVREEDKVFNEKFLAAQQAALTIAQQRTNEVMTALEEYEPVQPQEPGNNPGESVLEIDLHSMGLQADIIAHIEQYLPQASQEMLVELAMTERTEIMAFAEFRLLANELHATTVASAGVSDYVYDEIIKEIILGTPDYIETYNQTADILRTVHSEFESAINLRQSRIHVNCLLIRSGAELSFIQKITISYEIVRDAKAAAILFQMKSVIPQTPEGLAFDALLTVAGGPLLSKLGNLGKMVSKFDDVAGTKIASKVEPLIYSASRKVETLLDNVNNIKAKIFKVSSDNTINSAYRATLTSKEGQAFSTYGRELYDVAFKGGKYTVHTNESGGLEAARQAFLEITGNLPSNEIVSATLADGTRVVFRQISNTAPAKIEVINDITKVHEIISFQ